MMIKKKTKSKDMQLQKFKVYLEEIKKEKSYKMKNNIKSKKLLWKNYKKIFLSQKNLQ